MRHSRTTGLEGGTGTAEHGAGRAIVGRMAQWQIDSNGAAKQGHDVGVRARKCEGESGKAEAESERGHETAAAKDSGE
jgi:hypothetical protein